MLRNTKILFILIFLLFFQNIEAGTVLSSKGVGIPFFFTSSRSMGMGGISAALCDSLHISRVNHAALSGLKFSSISVQYFCENNDYRDHNGSARSTYANFDGFTFVVPLGKGHGFSIGMQPITRVDYNLRLDKSKDGMSYSKYITGSGGLSTFKFATYISLKSFLSIGISLNYIFGTIVEEWATEFHGEDFKTSSNQFHTENWGIRYQSGIIIRPVNFVTIGATYTTQSSLKNRTGLYITDIINNRVTKDSTWTGRIDFPSSWRVGTTFNISKYGLIGLEIYRRDWTELSINDRKISGTNSIYRYSIGAEYKGNNDANSYLKKISCRIGYYYQPYFSKDQNEKIISEHWVTFGFGFPLSKFTDRLDIAFCFGRRGSLKTNGLSENLFRLSIGISGGEKWFTRRY